MFIYFGSALSGVFNIRQNNFLLSQAMSDAAGPVAVSITQEETNTGPNFSPAFVGDMMNQIYLSGKSVFVKVACAPSLSRPTVAASVASAIGQITAIYNLFVGYNMLHRLQGFALNNIFFGERFSDNSVWTRNDVNSIALHAHSFNKSVMLLSDPALVSIGKFNQPFPYSSDASLNGYLAGAAEIGGNPAITDYVVNINILYPWHLYLEAYSQLIFDLSRFSDILTTARTFTKSNLKFLFHQSHPHSPYPDYFKVGFDDMMGPLVSAMYKSRLKRCATFIEIAGLRNYCFTVDTAYGAITNGFLIPSMYIGSGAAVNSSEILTNKVYSSGGYIYVNNGITTRKFDAQLNEITGV